MLCDLGRGVNDIVVDASLISNWYKGGTGSAIRAMHHQRNWIPPRLTDTPIKKELQILQIGIRETVFLATTDADQMSSHICTTGRY